MRKGGKEMGSVGVVAHQWSGPKARDGMAERVKVPRWRWRGQWRGQWRDQRGEWRKRLTGRYRGCGYGYGYGDAVSRGLAKDLRSRGVVGGGGGPPIKVDDSRFPCPWIGPHVDCYTYHVIVST